MRITRLELENWRNFLSVSVPLERRVFLVGPNASGKSNFLDALRFLRDIADPKGGFQSAVAARGGVSQIRSLHARRYPNVVIGIELDLEDEGQWGYRLEFSQDNQRVPKVSRERVTKNGKVIVDRPYKEDEEDPSRLTQTYLQQVNANRAFRVVAEALAQIRYLHLVPQLVREPDRSVGRERDPYGGDFLEQLAKTQSRTLTSRLNRIADALRVAVPQLKSLELSRDPATGVPHLRGLYQHWRPNAGWQTEEQFSDGTLRLFGLLWVFLDGAGPLLLEEPELSLHAAVIKTVPQIMARLGRKSGRQIIVSSHSFELLSDQGIDPREVLLLRPTEEGTVIEPAEDDGQVKALLDGGVSMAEAVIPRTAPNGAAQLALFGD